MRKPLLAVAVALAIPALYAPAASADETFQGVCTITGVATFRTPLTNTSSVNTYDFHSGDPTGANNPANDGTTCYGTLNGQDISKGAHAVAAVSGSGQLSCTQSQSLAPGSGYLMFPSTNSVFPFSFTFQGTGTEVSFTTTDKGVSSKGHASFAKYAGPDTLSKCQNSDPNKGVPSLGFDAQIGISETIQGYNNSAPPSNLSQKYGSSGGSSNGGGSGTGTGPHPRPANPCRAPT
jgi:hypothetical protein